MIPNQSNTAPEKNLVYHGNWFIASVKYNGTLYENLLFRARNENQAKSKIIKWLADKIDVGEVVAQFLIKHGRAVVALVKIESEKIEEREAEAKRHFNSLTIKCGFNGATDLADEAEFIAKTAVRKAKPQGNTLWPCLTDSDQYSAIGNG